MKKLFFSLFVSAFISTFCVAQTLEDYNKQLDVFKRDLKMESNAKLLKADSKKPTNLSKYLNEMGLEKEIVNTISHVEIDSKTDLTLLDVYSIQYSKDDYSKYLMVIENPKESESYILIDASFNFESNTVSVTNTEMGKSKWSECFGNCVDKGLSAHSTIGQAIIGMGIAAGFGCGPCGLVAASYTAIIVVGCAGGCNK